MTRSPVMADMFGMTRFESAQLESAPGWRELLAAYQSAAVAVADPETEGWQPRCNCVEGIEDSHLPVLHGRLIAVGLLTFQLIDRTAGLRYQLTAEGRQLLAAGENSQGEVPHDDEDCAAE